MIPLVLSDDANSYCNIRVYLNGVWLSTQSVIANGVGGQGDYSSWYFNLNSGMQEGHNTLTTKLVCPDSVVSPSDTISLNGFYESPPEPRPFDTNEGTGTPRDVTEPENYATEPGEPENYATEPGEPEDYAEEEGREPEDYAEEGPGDEENGDEESEE